MNKGILKSKSFSFALEILSLTKEMRKHKEYILSNQLTRSGTAIGALLCEAEFAQSKPDFISKLSIALKEANETDYWLLLIGESEMKFLMKCQELRIKLNEIIGLLVASLKTAKDNLKL